MERINQELGLRWRLVLSATSQGKFPKSKTAKVTYQPTTLEKPTAIHKVKMKTVIKFHYLSGTLPNALITKQKPLIKKSACCLGQAWIKSSVNTAECQTRQNTGA